jgi:hypothetical protein
MAFCDENRSAAFHSTADNANFGTLIGKKIDVNSEFLPARKYVDEPERELSPDTPRSSRHADFIQGDAPSFEIGQVPGRFRTTSCHSDATDFDDLTSPGAQAEQSEEYRRAVYGYMPQIQQFRYWNGMFAGTNVAMPAWASQSDQMSQFLVPSGSSADTLESQAQELNRAAEMLMKAANQAQAQALHMKGGEDGFAAASAASVSTPSAAQKPRWSDWEPEASESVFVPSVSSRTSVMMRNLPNDYTREMLLELLDAHGFQGEYDFIYLPVDFKRKAGLGYAFVNFSRPEVAERIFATMQGFKRWQYSSTKVLEVSWGEPLQGLDAHVDRYRNSPVMHRDVPDKFKPLLFQGNVRVPFPPATKRLQRPRAKAREPSAQQ